LERKLADADLSAREPAAFTAATKAYGDLRDALARAEDEWLGLEILREELEQP
jgi:ABC transport system ATP-binding/permease protein